MYPNTNQLLGDTSLKNHRKLRIAFFGNHIYGCCSLYALLDAGFRPEIVISNTSRDNEQIWYPSVSDLAIAHNIEEYRCNKVTRDGNIFTRIKDIKPDILVVSSYRNILGDHILNMCELGAINLSIYRVFE